MRRAGRALSIALCCAALAGAETGYDSWLRYAPVTGGPAIPAVLVCKGGTGPVESACNEVLRGVRGMLGRTLRREASSKEPAILVGTEEQLRRLYPRIVLPELAPESYLLESVTVAGIRHIAITGADERGVLYGAFAFLRKIALGESIAALNERQTPYAGTRWVNEWDNLDGSIERGYGGRSIFWENGSVRSDLSRVTDYARMLASLGINGCAINNVNANPKILDPAMIPQIRRIAEAFRPWGVRVAISVDFGSPKSVGGLDTFDPVNEQVKQWWGRVADGLYAEIPDLAGFVLKADSEGRVGPSFYKRSHADAANAVAAALRPHGGLLFYRGFVYDHHMDWRNPKNDRARAAVDNFQTLDGKFDENVLVQIKNGPIDFQVREPVSPLFGALEKTNVALELQITQEYMGQGRHVVFLAPQWKEVLDFDLQAKGANTPVKALAAGKTFGRPHGGIAGVSNVGLSENWYGNQMSQSNLYAFGRLAWNPDLGAAKIAEEWVRLTFGGDPLVMKNVPSILMRSWRAYENYTGPLGLQTLTDIVGNHYGVAVEASERNGWGQWHNADEKGAGMDRTAATGTGYAAQYRPTVAAAYESLAKIPDDLLLFFHHVPYTYVLHSGLTVIQSIYDSHYAGAAEVEKFLAEWQALKGRIDDQRFSAVTAQLTYQVGSSLVWRDAVSNYFLRASGIADSRNRVGNHPGRVEAEAMTRVGYVAAPVTPWEAASGGQAVSCPAARCSVTHQFNGTAGWYGIDVEYFDLPTGVSRFRLLVAGQEIDSWLANDLFPARKLDGTSSVRRTITGVALRPGDEVRIEGIPDGGDPAALDYMEIRRE